jgi:hypothetical protein
MQQTVVDIQPLVEVWDRENDTDLARALIHEFAHALLHFDVEGDTERLKRDPVGVQQLPRSRHRRRILYLPRLAAALTHRRM